MTEPGVSIGILTRKEVVFQLFGTYVVCGDKCVGNQKVTHAVEGLLWNGVHHVELLFEPTDEATCSFELQDVVIGINFHWERKESQIFRGALKIIEVNGELIVINLLGVEEYLTSVISSEMSATASAELLKAHAVISRSWLLVQMNKNKEEALLHKEHSSFTQDKGELIRWYDRDDHTHFDVCADDHCQRYQGITRASTSAVKEAIAATHGEVLMSKGHPCDARFSKCCGGAVEEFQYCWEPVEYPYLTSLLDSKNGEVLPDLRIEQEANRWIRTSPEAFCYTSDKRILNQVLNNYDQETIDFYRWKVSYTPEELTALVLQRSGTDYGLITDLIPLERGRSGRICKLRIVGTLQSMTIGKELEIRRTLSTSHLYSSAFVVDRDEEEHFVLTGAGWGHGVGLCQIGAAVMGEQGYDYKQILLHYYPGASIDNLYT